MYWVDGIFNNTISPSNRALHFGDGFFTTARLRNRKIDFLDWHIDRLNFSSKKLMFNNFDIDLLCQEIEKAAVIGIDGFIKIIVSRKNSNEKIQGYRYTNDFEISRIIYINQLPDYYSHWVKFGITIKTSTVRLSRNCFLAGVKHLNRLEQVMIANWICNNSIDEALVLDTEDNVIECCSANIFWRKNKQVFTPSLYYSGVNGIMRRLILQLLPKLGYLVKEVMVSSKCLKSADEVFITNSLLPVVSVNVIDDVFYQDKTLFCLLCTNINNIFHI